MKDFAKIELKDENGAVSCEMQGATITLLSLLTYGINRVYRGIPSAAAKKQFRRVVIQTFVEEDSPAWDTSDDGREGICIATEVPSERGGDDE